MLCLERVLTGAALLLSGFATYASADAQVVYRVEAGEDASGPCDGGGPFDCPSLRAAITAAQSQSQDWRIELAPGEHLLSASEPLLIDGNHIGEIRTASPAGGVPPEVLAVVRPTDSSYESPLLVISDGANLALRDLELRGGSAGDSWYAGAVQCVDASVSLGHVLLAGNTSSQGAGAIHATACELAIEDSEFLDNAAGADLSTTAGAIFARSGSVVSVSRTTFSENTANGTKAIRTDGSRTVLENVVVTDHVVDGVTSFTPVLLDTPATGTALRHVTIAGNTSTGLAAAGLRIQGGGDPVQITHSVIAGNAGTADISLAANSVLTSTGFNRIGVIAGAGTFTPEPGSDAVAQLDSGIVDGLVALGRNGFPRGLIPAADGPLVDAGDMQFDLAGACAVRDLAGRTRLPGGEHCDVGAVELLPDPTIWTFVASAGDDFSDQLPGDGVCAGGTGACSLRAALEESSALENGLHAEGFDIRLTQTGYDVDLATYGSLIVGEGNYFIGTDASSGEALPRIEATTPGNFPLFDLSNASGGTVIIRGVDVENDSGNAPQGIFCASNESAKRTLELQKARVRGFVESGGVHTNFCHLRVEDGVLSENEADLGAAIYVGGADLTLRRSTIVRNTARVFDVIQVDGTPITQLPAPQVDLLASTISANTAPADRVIVASLGGRTRVWGTTITENTAGAAIAIVYADGETSHSIIAGNTISDPVLGGDYAFAFGTFSSFGANLLGTKALQAQEIVEVPTSAPPSMRGMPWSALGLSELTLLDGMPAGEGHRPDVANPNGLAWNGGATVVTNDEAAIASGACLAYDQRRLPRIGGDPSAIPCDIGALEHFPGSEPDPGESGPIFKDGFE